MIDKYNYLKLEPYQDDLNDDEQEFLTGVFEFVSKNLQNGRSGAWIVEELILKGMDKELANYIVADTRQARELLI